MPVVCRDLCIYYRNEDVIDLFEQLIEKARDVAPIDVAKLHVFRTNVIVLVDAVFYVK